jgi:polyhydroxyalkanoate synthesis regulator phasin
VNPGSLLTIKGMHGKLNTDISKKVGGALSEEVTKMLAMFAANSESIESKFNSLHQRIDDLEQNVFAVIKQEKKIAIDSLKEEIRSLSEKLKDKDVQLSK